MAEYDFETEYRKIFETPLEEIKEDIFFRPDNFKNEKWYGYFQIYLAIGVCSPDRESVSDLQKALRVMGYPTRVKEHDGRVYIMPQREEVQKQAPARKHDDMER